MHSRVLRIVLVVACMGGVAATAALIRSFEQTLKTKSTALREVDARARDATDALAEVRAAQQAYLAFGQGAEFWMSKVDAAIQRVTAALATLQGTATTPASKTLLDEAVAAAAEFRNVDQRVRSYLKTNALLMAADIVFTEGGEAVAATGRHVEQARLEEHLTFDRFEADIRKQEIAAAGVAAGVVLLVTAILALVPARKPVETEQPETLLGLVAPEQPLQDASPAAATLLDDRLRVEDDLVLIPQDVAIPPPEQPKSEMAVLRTAAQICTEMGRVADPEELKGLLSRAADVLDASGLMLWLGSSSGDELRPALAHGYSPEIVSRIPAVPRSANNAAAAAFRSGTLQIVLARPGSTAKGAIVAPVLSPDGCVGVLSAEIRHGGEASETVQSLAAIFAAQLAGVVAPTSGVPEQRATGTGVVSL